MKRDTEGLWLLVRSLRSDYRKMAGMLERWGIKLELAEFQLKAILNDPSAQAAPAEIQSADASASEGDALAWDEQTR